jgi:hypothetical protein
MTAYHVTTQKKMERYRTSGCILPPVRFWPNEETARRWMKRTGRDVLVTFSLEGLTHHPLPDHRPARFTDEIIRDYQEARQ